MWTKIKSFFYDFLLKKILLEITECSKCHTKFQQLLNGVCIKCQKQIELAGAIEELNSLRKRPLGGLDFHQAKYNNTRISELESKIPRLKGELGSFNALKNK